MIEKAHSNHTNYHKKIVSYLDGSLDADERAEFEAFIRTHPEFQADVKAKQDELMLLKSLIPAAHPSRYTIESLESEMKLSIFNLLKEEPKNVSDRIRNAWDEWLNRSR